MFFRSLIFTTRPGKQEQAPNAGSQGPGADAGLTELIWGHGRVTR
jgi:hypothetical protein